MGQINGTSAADIISGTPGDDFILGHGGDDLILSSFGDDLIMGGWPRPDLRERRRRRTARQPWRR